TIAIITAIINGSHISRTTYATHSPITSPTASSPQRRKRFVSFKESLSSIIVRASPTFLIFRNVTKSHRRNNDALLPRFVPAIDSSLDPLPLPVIAAINAGTFLRLLSSPAWRRQSRLRLHRVSPHFGGRPSVFVILSPKRSKRRDTLH